MPYSSKGAFASMLFNGSFIVSANIFFISSSTLFLLRLMLSLPVLITSSLRTIFGSDILSISLERFFFLAETQITSLRFELQACFNAAIPCFAGIGDIPTESSMIFSMLLSTAIPPSFQRGQFIAKVLPNLVPLFTFAFLSLLKISIKALAAA